MSVIVNGVVSVILMALVISMLMELVKPYAPFLVLGLVATLAGGALARRYRRW